MNENSDTQRLNKSGQIITTSAEVTLNGGLIRELPQNPLNSGLGIILICPDKWWNSYGRSSPRSKILVAIATASIVEIGSLGPNM